MTDPEATEPPHQPNTFRTWLPRIMAWGKANLFASGMIIGVIVGLALPSVARMMFG